MQLSDTMMETPPLLSSNFAYVKSQLGSCLHLFILKTNAKSYTVALSGSQESKGSKWENFGEEHFLGGRSRFRSAVEKKISKGSHVSLIAHELIQSCAPYQLS